MEQTQDTPQTQNATTSINNPEEQMRKDLQYLHNKCNADVADFNARIADFNTKITALTQANNSLAALNNSLLSTISQLNNSILNLTKSNNCIQYGGVMSGTPMNPNMIHTMSSLNQMPLGQFPFGYDPSMNNGFSKSATKPNGK